MKDVLHNQADRIDDMTMRITSWDTGEEWCRVAASSNPTLKRSANGRPPGLGWRYAVHFLSPGPGVLPLSPA